MPRTLGIRKNPLKDQREEAFKGAALKLFSAKGYHRTTMEEIAHQAGFGKGALYWCWKSKEELYFALIEDMHREFLELAEKAAGREGDAWEKLQWLGKEFADPHYRDREYCKLSWKMRAEELETFSLQYVDRLYVYINRTKEKLQEIISQGTEEGFIPPLGSYYLACMLKGLLGGYGDPVAGGSPGFRPAHRRGYGHPPGSRLVSAPRKAAGGRGEGKAGESGGGRGRKGEAKRCLYPEGNCPRERRTRFL